MAIGGPPVTIVASGGVPMTPVAYGKEAPYTVVASGGFPITIADNAAPAVFLNADGSEYPRLPYDPSFDISLTDRFAFLSGEYLLSESRIKALFGTFSTPAHYATGTGALLYSVAANALDCFTVPSAVCRGQRIEEARTNKSTNYNANPTDGTNVTVSGGSIDVVDDAAELALAGLSNFATSGKVYRFTQSGVSKGSVVFGGTVGNTNAHSLSIWMRGTNASTTELRLTSGSGGAKTITAAYQQFKTENQTPANSTRQMALAEIPVGAVLYFIVNQLEEGSFVTSPIIVSGSSATRDASSIIRTLGSEWSTDGSLYLAGRVPISSGVTSVLGQLDDGTDNNRIVVYRHTDNKLYARVVVGGADQANLDLGAVSAGASIKVAMRVEQDNFAASLNGGTVVTDTSGSVPAVTSLRPGRSVAGTHWNDAVGRAALYTAKLTDAELASITT